MHSQSHVVKGSFKPQITVIGVGGAGGNAVNNMIVSGLDGVNFMVANTDAQALENSLCQNIIRLGTVSTGGLGAGARPEIGRAAAEETLDEVMAQLENQNMVFITAGMGGGTGTGAAPIIAQACKDRGILTVGVVTKPFQFEGAQRMRLAEAGIEEMAQYVDTLIVIPNQNLFRIANEKTTFAEAFRMADNVLQSGVKGVTDLMVVPGMINLDFADIRSATSEMGKAMMGTGEATGERRAIEAAEQAINNPLLDDVSMKGARSVIINITGGHDLTLFEIEEACNRINEEVDPDATIIFGSTYDDSMEGSIRITVVATGIEDELNRRAAITRPMRASAAPAVAAKQPKQADYAMPIADSFVARYPEPSRTGQTMSQESGIAPYQQNVAAIEPLTVTTFEQPARVTATADVAATYPQTADGNYLPHPSSSDVAPQVGASEPYFMAEGNTARKIDVAPEQSPVTPSARNVIPPFAPPREEQMKMVESAYILTPPLRPTHTAGLNNVAQPEQKKTPSLFDRITGRNRREEENTVSSHRDTASSSVSASEIMANGLVANRKTVATSYDAPLAPGQQGMLDIDAPVVQAKKTTSSFEDELEIPAFLRRQIS